MVSSPCALLSANKLSAQCATHARQGRPSTHRCPVLCGASLQEPSPQNSLKLNVPLAAASFASCALLGFSSVAADLSNVASSAGDISVAVGGGAAVAALSAALVATDPQKRRTEQLAQTGGDEKEAVKNYFNTAGFERWRKIYGETDDVNKVQLDIRTGHAETVDKVLRWLDEEGSVEGVTICDAGCGTGSLAIPLALKGAKVNGSDISAAMVSEAERRFQEAAVGSSTAVEPTFEALDLESVSGRFHTVTCIDVMIHYPQDKVDGMIQHLAGLAEQRLIISFAPKTLAYSVLKRIGELFPGPSKATRAYLHAEDDVEEALRKAGWKVVKKEMTATRFYFSRLFEAVPI